MTNLEDQHDLVKKSLITFISGHIPEADFSVVDEIVLQYIISILEEAAEDPSFDVDGFIEIMSAYFTEFSSIDSQTIRNWIFKLENELSELGKSKQSDGAINISFNTLSLSDAIPKSKLMGRQTSNSDKEDFACALPKNRGGHHLSETSDCGSTDSSGCEYFIDECDVLQEMFPDTSDLEVKHCIGIAKGDIDSAIQLILHRQDSGQSISEKSAALHAPKNTVINDSELKNRIIARYSYVDKNAATREYKPVVPKVEPKKLVRYRDNKIVSLKGERYTEIRRDDQEAELKKPKKLANP